MIFRSKENKGIGNGLHFDENHSLSLYLLKFFAENLIITDYISLNTKIYKGIFNSTYITENLEIMI